MDDERAGRFEEIVENIIKFVDPGYGTKYVNDRAISVTRFIEDVVEIVEKRVPHLKVSEILPIGGFYEGTKIKSADEFDFLAVVDELSRPGAVTIERDSVIKEGQVKLKLSPGTDSDGRWEMFSKDGYLRCFEEVRQTAKEDSFGRRVMQAIPKLEQNKGRDGLITHQNVNYRCRPTIIYSRRKIVEHIAMIYSGDVSHPNVLLEFSFMGEKVSTDLCPAIRYNAVEDLFDPKYCFNEILAKEVISKGSILLVGKGDFQYRVTYTETELDYMKNKISRGHKSLYIFLKAISSCFKEYFAPSSYSLKVTCMKHDLLCQNTNGSKTLLQCFYEIIDDIVCWNREAELPSIFDRRLDLLPSVLYFKMGTDYSREIVAPLFKDIKKLCQNVSTASPERFLEQVKSIVECWDNRSGVKDYRVGTNKPPHLIERISYLRRP